MHLPGDARDVELDVAAGRERAGAVQHGRGGVATGVGVHHAPGGPGQVDRVGHGGRDVGDVHIRIAGARAVSRRVHRHGLDVGRHDTEQSRGDVEPALLEPVQSPVWNEPGTPGDVARAIVHLKIIMAACVDVVEVHRVGAA